MFKIEPAKDKVMYLNRAIIKFSDKCTIAWETRNVILTFIAGGRGGERTALRLDELECREGAEAADAAHARGRGHAGRGRCQHYSVSQTGLCFYAFFLRRGLSLVSRAYSTRKSFCYYVVWGVAAPFCIGKSSLWRPFSWNYSQTLKLVRKRITTNWVSSRWSSFFAFLCCC